MKSADDSDADAAFDGLTALERYCVTALLRLPPTFKKSARQISTFRSGELSSALARSQADLGDLPHVDDVALKPWMSEIPGMERAYLVLVRAAQRFFTRYPLVDVRGNAGSACNDSPAGACFTEMRASRLLKNV